MKLNYTDAWKKPASGTKVALDKVTSWRFYQFVHQLDSFHVVSKWPLWLETFHEGKQNVNSNRSSRNHINNWIHSSTELWSKQTEACKCGFNPTLSSFTVLRPSCMLTTVLSGQQVKMKSHLVLRVPSPIGRLKWTINSPDFTHLLIFSTVFSL